MHRSNQAGKFALTFAAEMTSSLEASLSFNVLVPSSTKVDLITFATEMRPSGKLSCTPYIDPCQGLCFKRKMNHDRVQFCVNKHLCVIHYPIYELSEEKQ